MENSYLDLINKRKKLEICNIRKCNEYSKKYGLTLTENNIKNIIERRTETLKETNRIEFGDGIIKKIIMKFCDSPFIDMDNYANTMYELIDIFYLYKNETIDMISDDDLLEFMKKSFDGECQGDLDYLSGTVMKKMKNDILNRKV